MAEFDISGKNAMNPEELEAQLALEAQLTYTKALIDRLNAHPHFTDDCGEYLRTALDLSTILMKGREDGIEGLIETIKELAKTPEGGEEGFDTELSMYACDGISPSLEDLVNKYNAKEKE